jgi:2-C-methyl-D-erythritol 2,4-cyclodiphosphate synthase
MRTGIGYDIHRLVPTVEPSTIPIGGVDLPCYFRVNAVSDGDVLLHALVDSCLGALALGDIGQWFPENKPENKGRRSVEFVREVMSHLYGMGWKVSNFDCVVILEEPRLAKHADTIRQSIARLLDVELSAVSLKAKTMEGLGPIGERKAIAAHSIVTLERKTEGHLKGDNCPPRTPQ